MEPYIIEVEIKGINEILLVYPVEKEESKEHLFYDVYHQGKKLGTIFPELNNPFEADWYTTDLISKELVEEIGRQIVMKDL